MTERTFSSALVLFAHPDDAEFLCGRPLAPGGRAGCQVHYLIVTHASAVSKPPGVTREQMRPIREREQRAAADVLGVESVTFLGEVDGMLEVNLDTRRKVCREVRRLRPEVLVSTDPSRLWSGRGYVNHWDHKQAGLLALTATMPDAPSRPMFPELEDEGIEPFEVPNLWLVSDQPDTYVDITDTFDTKLAALAEHVSQGTGDAEPWVRKWAEELGSTSDQGFALAEGFKGLRLVDDEEDG